MRIALCQIRSVVGDTKANLDRMVSLVESNHADLFVFSEMSLTGYMCRDGVIGLAEEVDGESISYLSDVSMRTGKAVLIGMPLKNPEITGLLNNSAVLITPDGAVQIYDKIHPANFGPFEEGFYFAPGDYLGLMEFLDYRIGVCICYDLFFPEICREYALQGADILICISASPITSRTNFEKIIPARAVENTCYMVYVNHVGSQLNMVFFGGSQANGPRGDLLVKLPYLDEDVRIIDVDRNELERARRARPTLRDG